MVWKGTLQRRVAKSKRSASKTLQKAEKEAQKGTAKSLISVTETIRHWEE